MRRVGSKAIGAKLQSRNEKTFMVMAARTNDEMVVWKSLARKFVRGGVMSVR